MKPPPAPFGYSDAARRLSDTINLHSTVLSTTEILGGMHWVAFRLADGYTNGFTYPSFEIAVKEHENLSMSYGYVRVPPNGMIIAEAESLIKYWRFAYNAGYTANKLLVLGGN